VGNVHVSTTQWGSRNAVTYRSGRILGRRTGAGWLVAMARHWVCPSGTGRGSRSASQRDYDPTDRPTTNPSPTVWQAASLLTAHSPRRLSRKTTETLGQSGLGLRTCHTTRYKLWNNLRLMYSISGRRRVGGVGELVAGGWGRISQNEVKEENERDAMTISVVTVLGPSSNFPVYLFSLTYLAYCLLTVSLPSFMPNVVFASHCSKSLGALIYVS